MPVIKLSWKEELTSLSRVLLSTLLQRGETYGDPTDSMRHHAEFFSRVLGQEVPPERAAMLLAALKLSRLSYDPEHLDSWMDLAGYALIGAMLCGHRAREGVQE